MNNDLETLIGFLDKYKNGSFSNAFFSGDAKLMSACIQELVGEGDVLISHATGHSRLDCINISNPLLEIYKDFGVKGVVETLDMLKNKSAVPLNYIHVYKGVFCEEEVSLDDVKIISFDINSEKYYQLSRRLLNKKGEDGFSLYDQQYSAIIRKVPGLDMLSSACESEFYNWYYDSVQGDFVLFDAISSFSKNRVKSVVIFTWSDCDYMNYFLTAGNVFHSEFNFLPFDKVLQVSSELIFESIFAKNKVMTMDEKYRVAMNRLATSHFRRNVIDKIFDLSTAIELMVGDNSGSSGYKLELRTAVLSSSSYEKRLKNRKYISDFYRVRSSVFHGGKVRLDFGGKSGGKVKGVTIGDIYEGTYNISLDCMREIIRNSGEAIDWDNIELSMQLPISPEY